MKPLSSYPVTYPYGATTAPYSATRPHHGDDIDAETGTPIDVNGVVIGLVGSTGFSSGPHCHIDKNKELWATSGYVNPSDWKNITGTVVAAGDFGTAGLAVVIQADNGYFYRFLHMSKINATEGQKIGLMIEKQPPVFKASYYLKMNPDVAKQYTLKTAVDHWIKYGIKEGRKSAPNFHVKEYLANYGDLRTAYGASGYAKAVKHYFNNGINEGRSGRTIKPTVSITALKDKIINFVKSA